MAEQSDFLGMGALSAAVVALVRGLEFVIGKLWSGDTASLHKHCADRLTVLETKIAVLEARDQAADTRLSEVTRWLERIDAKLERLTARGSV